MKCFSGGEHLDRKFQVLRFRSPSESIPFTKTYALFKAVNLFTIIRCVPTRRAQRWEQSRVISNTKSFEKILSWIFRLLSVAIIACSLNKYTHNENKYPARHWERRLIEGRAYSRAAPIYKLDATKKSFILIERYIFHLFETITVSNRNVSSLWALFSGVWQPCNRKFPVLIQ